MGIDSFQWFFFSEEAEFTLVIVLMIAGIVLLAVDKVIRVGERLK